jgi:hypothetical protein
MGEAKNELDGGAELASACEYEESGESCTAGGSSVVSSLQPISLAYWIEGGMDLSPISGHMAKQNLGHLDSLQPFATSSKGEKVALYTVFPLLSALGRLMPCCDYYSVMSTTNLRDEKCYNPVRLLMFIVPDESGLERQLLVVAEVRQEREFLKRRLDLLAGKAGAVWHHTANQATAGLGFLGFAEASLTEVLDGSRSLSADTLAAVRGGGRALNATQESIRVVCALARCHDGAREIGLKEGLEVFSRFSRGMYAPDMRVEVRQANDGGREDGEHGASGATVRQAGQVLLPETSLLHLIFELMHVVYLRGGREITWHVLSNREAKMEVGFDISWPEEIGFLIAAAVGRAYGIGVESLGKRSVRCIVW